MVGSTFFELVPVASIVNIKRHSLLDFSFSVICEIHMTLFRILMMPLPFAKTSWLLFSAVTT